MTVVTHYISENKKKLVMRHCVTESASITILHGVITRGQHKRVDMRYPLKYDTTKKESLDFNDL